MLAPDGRAVLLDALRPPQGYELGFAVATTFTLDLAAALIVPLAFAGSQLGEAKDPVAVMEAVRSSADRVAIFCQAGNIVVPQQASDLVAFIEQCVHEVRRPKPGHLFHPKLWALRYEAEEHEPTYRLLVLTRNLTLDRSWDLVLRLDSDDTRRRRNRDNEQLARLIETLPHLVTSQLADDRVERVQSLADEIRRVIWQAPDDVKELRFWSYGIGRQAEPDMTGYRHLIMSPFVTSGGLARFDSDELTLVSRADDLDRLEADALAGIDVRALDPLVGYGDPTSDSSAYADDDARDGEATTREPHGLRDLHAKFYVVERARRAHVFIGSANATDAAFEGNVELLCELVGGATKLGVDAVLDPEHGIGSLLQDYTPGTDGADPEVDDLQRKLEDLLRSAAEVTFTACVAVDAEGWSVELTTPKALPAGATYSVAPLNRPVEMHSALDGEPVRVRFGSRPAADVTAFYILTARVDDPRVDARSTVVRAVLVNAPATRLDEIIARQVDTPEKFLRFLLLLLGTTAEGFLGVETLIEGSDGGALSRWTANASGVLELLVTALATRPRALDEIAGLVERLTATDTGRAVLPEGFDDLWQVFTEARERLARSIR